MNWGKALKQGSSTVVIGKGSSEAVAIIEDRRPIGSSVRLSIPLGGTMAAFEEAIFKNGTGLPLVNFIFTFNSFTPWEIAQSAAIQIAGFADLINDINGVQDFNDYFGSAWETLKRMGEGFYKDGKILDTARYGMTIFFDPDDVILPDVVEKSYSMSLKNQLTYGLSVTRLNKYATKWWVDDHTNSLEVVL